MQGYVIVHIQLQEITVDSDNGDRSLAAKRTALQ